MRVEVRRRAGPAAAPKREASANPGLVKAYSDSCFESPTNFYIASPEHPKLGIWAKPSTLKYSQPPPQIDYITKQCLDEAMLFASTTSHRGGGSKPRKTVGRSRPVGRGGGGKHERGGKPASTVGGSASLAGAAPTAAYRAKPSRAAVEPARAKRPISPLGASPSARIDTPISGRVRSERAFVCEFVHPLLLNIVRASRRHAHMTQPGSLLR